MQQEIRFLELIKLQTQNHVIYDPEAGAL